MTIKLFNWSNCLSILFPEIWLVGDSLVKRAELFTNRMSIQFPDQGKFDFIWMGKSGMTWEELPQTIQMIFRPKPKAVFLHLGGNSVATQKQSALMTQIANDINYISEVFTSTKIIWCDILPRLTWRNNLFPDCKTLNKKVRRINRSVRSFMKSLPNGHFISFKIHESMQELFLQDGVHLSEHGNLLYIQTLCNFIKTELTDN